MMNKNQKFIALYAQTLVYEGKTNTFPELREKMLEEGLAPGSTNLALGNQISTAYKQALAEKNQGVATDIAMAFTDENGEYYWDR